MFKGLIKHLTKEKKGKSAVTQKKQKKQTIRPVIIPRSQHTISRSRVSPQALKVLYRLHQAGYSAYLVGGCVRDLLLGYRPKDFDIATNALPDEVRRLFSNCRLIGKRFRLAHILFGNDIIEVATFRAHHDNAENEQDAKSHKGMIVRDNVYGTLEDDVWRRDFSINALYYNIADFSVVDYVNGIKDIEQKTLRMIGDPDQRFHEDPVRILRAVRFMGKLDLKISPETESLIAPLRHLLQHVASARLFQEVLKFFHEGATTATFALLIKYRLLEELFPATAVSLQHIETKRLIEATLKHTDERIRAKKTVSSSFLFAVFLWHPIIKQTIEHKTKNDLPHFVALEQAIQHVMKQQCKILAIPRNVQIAIREICSLQHRLTYRHGARAYRLLNHPRFRAGYDLLQLRAQTGETDVVELAAWWESFSTSDEAAREKLSQQVAPRHSEAKHGKRRRPRRFMRKPMAQKDFP